MVNSLLVENTVSHQYLPEEQDEGRGRASQAGPGLSSGLRVRTETYRRVLRRYLCRTRFRQLPALNATLHSKAAQCDRGIPTLNYALSGGLRGYGLS